MNKGDIVLVPFPFDDLSTTKVRPALCLTKSVAPHNHIVLAFISSKVPDELSGSDYLIDKETDWFEKTGLKVRSVVKLHRLITVTSTYVKNRLGAFPLDKWKAIEKRLLHTFEIE